MADHARVKIGEASWLVTYKKPLMLTPQCLYLIYKGATSTMPRMLDWLSRYGNATQGVDDAKLRSSPELRGKWHAWRAAWKSGDVRNQIAQQCPHDGIANIFLKHHATRPLIRLSLTITQTNRLELSISRKSPNKHDRTQHLLVNTAAEDLANQPQRIHAQLRN